MALHKIHKLYFGSVKKSVTPNEQGRASIYGFPEFRTEGFVDGKHSPASIFGKTYAGNRSLKEMSIKKVGEVDQVEP